MTNKIVAGLVVGAACTIGAAAPAAAAEWTYKGERGVNHWGSLSEEYILCQAGTQQSPVDLADPIPADVGGIEIDWQPTKLAVENNGHTIQVNTANAGGVTLDGRAYALKQFHFHNPSEHALDGGRFPMEAHFVHANEQGGLTVLGVFLEEGEANPLIEQVWAAAPSGVGETVIDATIDITQLLPEGRGFMRYNGSLTTPPCSEIVNWVVFDTPVTVSKQQIETFENLYAESARPLQERNRRFILGAGEG